MRLSDAQTGDKVVIVKVTGHGAFRKRVLEMGFVKGRIVDVLESAPLKDPVRYRIMGYEISLRLAEAELIEVIKVDEESVLKNIYHIQDLVSDSNELNSEKSIHKVVESHHKTISIALIGNPNCGKTSLFNIASGAKERVGNYSGVTVDAKTGTFKYKGYTFNIIDLPGTYSLSSYSPEELYVRRYLSDYEPDVIVNVVDSSNLERNLYLTTELIDMDRSMVIALNMYDELRAHGSKLDYKVLGGMIGVPMVPIVSKTGEGIDHLFDTIISVYNQEHESVRHIHVNLGREIEEGVRAIVDLLKSTPDIDRHFSPRYLAIKLLEDDQEAREIVRKSKDWQGILDAVDKWRQKIEKSRNQDLSAEIAGEKYGFISGALAETMTGIEQQTRSSSSIIDAFVTNKLFGFPIFLAIMFFVFWLTFSLGQYPMEWIENLVAWISTILNQYMPDGILKDLIADGVIGGVGGVIVFLPNILILYFCISFMEDTGYMARAAFIMDKLMHRIGLHGKSFIPLIMGFGCNVPAIMASRTIESHSSRIITILINPFMSCSARLPIYVLLIGCFFPSHAAIVFFSLYVLGVIAAIITARLLRRFWFKKDETPFVMELPPYRIPTLKSSIRHTWAKGQQYLRKMGGVILLASIIVWALNYFPHHTAEPVNETASTIVENQKSDTEIDINNDSFLEMAGKFINPVMEPLGFHWRATVAAMAGVPAKEIVVSTLGVLYTNDESVDDTRLSARLEAPSPATGKPDFNAINALSFMVFILLYCPCIATVTAIVRETGSIKYGLFSICYNTLLAWIVAFAVYNIGSLF